MNAIILSIGDELILGQTIDTNSAWLSQQLAAVGCAVLALVTVPDAPLDRLLAPDAVVAARDLLDALGIRAGDRILVGGAEFRVAASLEREAGRVGLQAMLGPRVYLSDEGLARTVRWYAEHDGWGGSPRE